MPAQLGIAGGESHQRLGIAKALLANQQLTEAGHHCAEALGLKVLATSFQAALVLGIVFLSQRNSAAGETFTDASSRCQALLEKTPGLYEPRYASAAALVGQAVCDPRWAEENERAELLAPALGEYRKALEITSAKGVVQDAIRDLELIHAADIEGLEPVSELLESALA